MASDPIFFELSWSILSTIGACNVFFGLLVISVTNLSPIAAVPLVTSTACAIANGLCFYAFYLPTVPSMNRAVASAFADMAWMIQEAGMSLYSYVILSRILRDRQWYVYAGLFWTTMVAIVVVRINIAVTRVMYINSQNAALQRTVNYLHMAYFPFIAILESVNAFYLLRTFTHAQMSCLRRQSKASLLRYLMRSTEVRLALLALVGIMRAVTYWFQDRAQRATNLASQVDRFCYTMECLFPIIMYIDMLSSKIVYTNQQQERCGVPLNLQHPQPDIGVEPSAAKATGSFPTTSRVEHVEMENVSSGSGAGSPQARIMRAAPPFGEAVSHYDSEVMDQSCAGINNRRSEIGVAVSERRDESPSISG